MVGLNRTAMSSITIYLSGSIRKGTEDTRPDIYFWTRENEVEISSHISRPIRFLNPARTDIDRNDFFANFGCDLFLVSKSDVVLADLRKKKGIGIGAELMLADSLGIPVIGLLTKPSDYWKESLTNVSGQNLKNWTHPFAFGLCDKLCDTLSEACELIEQASLRDNFQSLYREKSNRAISYFLNKYPGFSNFND